MNKLYVNGKEAGTVLHMLIEGETALTINGEFIGPERICIDRERGTITILPADLELPTTINVPYTAYAKREKRVAQWKQRRFGAKR